MDVRNFMPERKQIRRKGKKQKLVIEPDANENNASSSDFTAAIKALLDQNEIESTQPSFKKIKDKKLTRSAEDIFAKYKKKSVGKGDVTVDSSAWIKQHLLINSRMKANTIYRIMKYYDVIKNNPVGQTDLMLSKIISHPFNFLNETHQFLSFKRCEFIMTVYKLYKISKMVIAKGFIFDKFLGENTYYLQQYKFVHESQKDKISKIKFLEKTNSSSFPYKYDILENDFYDTLTKHGIQKSDGVFDDKSLTLKSINGSRKNSFWTTEHFLELEKNYGGLMIRTYKDKRIEGEHKKNAIKKWIKQVEPVVGITLNENQVRAVHTALRYKLLCISGYPGTGKSTIVDFIVRYRREVMGEPTCLMAPTGKAVKSLMNKLKISENQRGTSALIATCHKFVYTIFNEYEKAMTDPTYELKDSLIKDYVATKKNPFGCVVIDEASMMDFNIFMIVIDFVVKYGGSIIFVGDINQLPPVSAGRPFERIYRCGHFKSVELNEIMRSTNKISSFVLDLNANDYLRLSTHFDDKEIKFYNCSELDNTYVKKFFKKIIQTDGLMSLKRNYSIISAQNGDQDRDWNGSVNQLNELIQSLCLEEIKREKLENKDASELLSVKVGRKYYYDGDRIIRTVNDYSTGNIRVNGEMGTLMIRENLEKRKKKDPELYITINYDDGDAEEVDADDLEQSFNLAYASTVHKMQGSENKKIVVVMSHAHYMWQGEGCKKLLYTAVSRAKEELLILSSFGAFEKCLENCKKIEKSFHTEFLK